MTHMHISHNDLAWQANTTAGSSSVIVRQECWEVTKAHIGAVCQFDNWLLGRSPSCV